MAQINGLFGVPYQELPYFDGNFSGEKTVKKLTDLSRPTFWIWVKKDWQLFFLSSFISEAVEIWKEKQTESLENKNGRWQELNKPMVSHSFSKQHIQ